MPASATLEKTTVADTFKMRPVCTRSSIRAFWSSVSAGESCGGSAAAAAALPLPLAGYDAIGMAARVALGELDELDELK